MSDDDRGAYTPHREAPLQFDARRGRDARPMPMTLIGSAVVLVVLVGAVIMAYAGGFKHKDEPAKTVGDRVLVMKSAPPPGQGAPVDPAAKLEVFSERSAPAAPTFAPEPEKPAPLPPPRVVAAAPPALRTAPVVPTPLPPIEAAPRATATALPAARAPASAPAATASVAGGFGAQIGAFSSRELAEKGFADVGRIASTSGRGKRVEPVEVNGSTLYRTTVTGFADREAAKAFCAALSAKGRACFVKS
jgi:hypothetical protein